MNDFRPINLDPKRANRAERRRLAKEPLFQVHCETAEGELIPFGPKAGKSFCERLLENLNLQIIKGAIRDLQNPHLARVLTQ